MSFFPYTHIPFRPRFYYGWVMVAIAMLGTMCTAPAQTYGISVFIPFIRAELELVPAQTAGAYMMGTFLASLPLTWVGACMDRYGPRRTMTVVIVGFCGACLLLSQVTGLLSLFAAFFLIRLFGQGALTLLSANTIAYWFHRRLGTVSGLKAMGVALAIAGAPALHYYLIRQVGWRTAYIVLAGVIAGLLLPLMLVVYRNRPEEVGQEMEQGQKQNPSSPAISPARDWSFHQALQTRTYWIVAFCLALWGLIATAVAFCAASIFESRGLSTSDAAARVSGMFAAMGFTLMATHVLAGWLADRMKVHRMLTVTMLSMTGIGLLLGWPGSENHVWAIGIIMGVCQSLTSAISATVWVRFYGRAALGRIRGSTFTLLVAMSSIGPFLVDGMAALTGSYDAVLNGLIWLPLPLALAAWTVSTPADKR